MKSGGGKNSLARKPPLKTINLSIGTYNIRTLRTEDRMEELEEELGHINWDIIGLCET